MSIDYTSFLDESGHVQTETAQSIESNELRQIERESLIPVFELINGRDNEGQGKVAVSYETYILDDESEDKSMSYTTLKPAVFLSFDSFNPDWFSLDIVFHSYQEPELKLLWGLLQRFKNNLSKHPDKDCLFFLNIVQKDCVSVLDTGEDDMLFSIQMINPVLYYLTADSPTALGMNTIRMLFDVSAVQFSYHKLEELRQEKINVLSSIEEERYRDLDKVTTKFDDTLL